MHTGWIVDQGGVTSYIAKDEDEEVKATMVSSAVRCSILGPRWFYLYSFSDRQYLTKSRVLVGVKIQA